MKSLQKPFFSWTSGVAALLAVFFLTGCPGGRARSSKSFDEIHRMVAGKAAREVVGLLGEPDSRQPIFGADEKWIWWNYTYLDGNDFPPEVRGHVVHLEIIFKKTSREEWRVDGELAVGYRLPSSGGGA